MPSLRWLAPEGPPRVFSVFKQITTIGRARSNDVAIPEPSLANHHVQLVFDGKEFGFAELDRDAPILWNGKKKRRGSLQHQDRLTLGTVDLVFSVFDEALARDESDEPEADGLRGAELVGMRKLAELVRKLAELRDPVEQVNVLLGAAIEATSAEKGFVVLTVDGKNRIAAARRVDGRALPDAVEQLSDSILAKVVETRRPLIVSDALHDTQFRSSESVMNLRLSSVIAAPLLAHGQLLGIIYLGNDQIVRLFDETSLDILTVLAGQAALLLENALAYGALALDNDRLRASIGGAGESGVIGACPGLVDVLRKVERVASTDVSVLITGETGTGKELIAREIHRRSPRTKGPFVVVNCGAIPETLMEAELFGHVRGAFTGAVATRGGRFQAAHGGTLFLDEIGEMPMALQVKLLRALQEREVTKIGDAKPEKVDIRVLAATHRDLEQMVKDGRFREDLYYRLNVVNLHLPPLRERGEDVVVIAKHLLSRFAAEMGSKVRGFAPAALTALRRHPFPGNVRELENRLKKAIVLADGPLLGAEDLDLATASLPAIVPLAQAREEYTRRYVLEVLELNNGNRTKTAADLGVDPRTVFRYLEREGEPPLTEP